MNERELADFIPDLVEKYLPEGTIGLGQLPSELVEGLSHRHDYGTWSFRRGSAVVVLHVHKNATLLITAALALNVPFTSEVSHHLNGLNAKEISLGRLFVAEFEGTGRGGILLQEMVYADGLSWEHQPSIQTLIRVVATVAHQADRWSAELCQRFGGDLPADEADGLILTLE
jgi:hypothetical protein